MAFIGSILTTGSFTGAHKQVATLKSSGGGGTVDGAGASAVPGRYTSGSFELVIQTGDVGNGSAFRGTSGSFRIDVKNGGSFLQALRVGADQAGGFIQTGHGSLDGSNLRIVDISNNEFFRADADTGASIFNEGSADLDFRVESNGLTHAIFVEGSSDRVAIGSNAPMGALDVNDNGGDHCIVMRNNDSSGVASQYRAFQIGASGQLYISGTSGKTQFISDVAGADSEVFILSKLDAGGSTAGDGRIWFGHKAADGTTNSLEAYMGYDVSAGSTQAIRMGFSSTFGGGERLTLDEENGVVVVNEDSGDIDFRVESNTSTKAFFVDGGANKIYCGLDSDATLGTPTTFGSDYAKFTIVDAHSNPLDKAGGSGDNLVDFALELRNHDISGNSMTGIAFNVNTERDANSVGAAIVAERDSTAAADATLYDTNLHFMTNDSGDTGNTVRMTISHDGKVQIGNGSGDLSSGTGMVLITGDMSAGSYYDPDYYHLMLHQDSSSTDEARLGFAVATDNDEVGGAIVFRRTDSESQGELRFYTKQATTDAAAPTLALRLTDSGAVEIGSISSDSLDYGQLQVRKKDSNCSITMTRFDGGVVGGTGTLVDGNDLGYLRWRGSEWNGVNYSSVLHVGAAIMAECAGTWSSSSAPTRMKFQVTNSSATSPSTRMVIDEAGNVGIGDATPDLRFVASHSRGSGTDNVCFRMENTNSSTGSDVLELKLGVSSGSSTSSNMYIVFKAASTRIGRIAADGSGGIATLDAFTGGHPTVIPSDSTGELGMIVESTGQIWAKSAIEVGVSTGIPKVQLTTSSGSKKVYGVVGEIYTGDNEEYGYAGYVANWGVGENENHIRVNSLGEGQVLVTNINGEIENGDYIISSDISGLGQKQNDDILRSSTVAKCVEDVDWASITDTVTHDGQTYKKALVACTYHCG